MLGFVTLGACRDPDVDQATTGEIWGIYLGPQHWRKGVGRRLCQSAEQMLTSQHYRQAILWVLRRTTPPEGSMKRWVTRLMAHRKRSTLVPPSKRSAIENN